MKFGNIFWGVMLIFLGVFFLMQKMGVIDFQWVYLWRLWPVILVLWGISILPAHNLLKTILVVLVLAGSVYFMIDRTVTWNDPSWDYRVDKWDDWEDDDENFPVEQTFNIPYEDSVGKAYLEVDLAAGSFFINEGTDYLLDFSKKGYKGKYSYVIKKLDDKTEIFIERDNVRITSGNNKHKVNLSLNEFPVWDLNMDIGASAVNLDLSNYRVSNLEVDGGAAAIDIRLGDNYPEMDVSIDAGASAIELAIPESSGCKLNVNSVLSGKSIKGFEKIDHGHYKTENFEEAENKIYIQLDAAVSSYSIIRY